MPKPLTVFLFRGHGEVMSMSEMLSFGACLRRLPHAKHLLLQFCATPILVKYIQFYR